MLDTDDNIDEQYAIAASVIPELNFHSHKGQSGRVGVIGGCTEYTGAPYFAAIAALKTGCDLSFIFCTRDAANPIKSYSPELIVYPVLDQPKGADAILQVLPRLHSLVIGPGLGRNPSIFPVLRNVILEAKQLDLPIVFDADGLHYISLSLELIKGYRSAIFTPNIAEFARLSETLFKKSFDSKMLAEGVKKVAAELGNVTIVLKHENDVISDGIQVVRCTELGSPRRCGGQGDILSGAMGTFNYWSHLYSKNNPNGCRYSATVVAALGACLLTKRCSQIAFSSLGRSMTTTDMIAQIGNAFKDVFRTAS